MAFINWDSHLSVGIPAMDQQHKKMADIINHIHQGLRTNLEDAKLIILVDALIQVTQVHLEEEEQMMERMGFPGTESHKEGHRHITEKLVQLRAQLESGSRPGLAEAGAFIKEWFTTHVQKDDRDYGVYLQNERIRVRAGSSHSPRPKKEEPAK